MNRLFLFYLAILNLMFYRNEAQKTAKAGEPFSIPCHFGMVGVLRPNGTGCTWTLNDNDIFMDNSTDPEYKVTFSSPTWATICSLTIKNVSLERDYGNWTCKLNQINVTSPLSQTIFLNVTVYSSMPKIYYQGQPIENEAAVNVTFEVGQLKNPVLSCVSLKGYPAADLKWIDTYSTKSHIVTNKTKNAEDKSLWDSYSEIEITRSSGIITCTSRQQSTFKTVRVHIHAKVADIRNFQFLAEPSNAVVEENEGIVLKCKFNGTTKGCNWTRNSTSVSLNQNYELNGNIENGDCSMKIIKPILYRDNGFWKCQLPQYNGRTLVSRPALLSVVVKPSSPIIYYLQEPISQLELPSTIGTSGSVTVVCISRNGFPAANLQWVVNGKRESERVLHKIEMNSHEDSRLWDSYSYQLVTSHVKRLTCVASHPANLMHHQEVEISVYSSEANNAGIIIGIVFACIIAAVIVILVFMYRRKVGFFANRTNRSSILNNSSSEQTVF